MKKSILTAALTATLGVVSSGAYAWVPAPEVAGSTVVDSTVSGNSGNGVRWSGATASTNTLRYYIIDNWCDATQPIDVFMGAGWAVACDADLTAGVNNRVFRKHDAGGSASGVVPVARAQALPFIQMGTGAGSNCPSAAVASTTPTSGTAYNQYTCGTGTVNIVTQAGISDIEPEKFRDLNTPPGGVAFDPVNDAPKLKTFGLFDLVFNTPVSLNLYRALQAVQYPSTSPCNPANAGYIAAVTVADTGVATTQGETQECMPSLTYPEIRALFSGKVNNWTDFFAQSAADVTGRTKTSLKNNGRIQAAVAAGMLTLPSDDYVQICRRVPGSGTQAEFNVIIMGKICNASGINPSAGSNLLGGPKVELGSGSGDVEKCFDAYNDGTSDATFKTVNASGVEVAQTINATLTKRWAIGIQSTEKNVNLAHRYRFIKQNNFAPTITNVQKGDYEQWATTSCHFNTTTVPSTNPDYNLISSLCQNMTKPADVATSNLALRYPWGPGGLLVNFDNKGTNVPGYEFDQDMPVNTQSRKNGLGSIDMCQPPYAAASVEVDTNICQNCVEDSRPNDGVNQGQTAATVKVNTP